MSVMMLTGNYVFITYYGDAGVASFSIACFLFPLIFMMSNAVAQSAQPIISYNYGAGMPSRMREAFSLSIRVAILCGVIAFGAIAFGSDSIVALFIDPSCEAGRLATYGLPIYALCAVFFAVNISFIGYYQSVERALKAMIFTLMRGVILLIPMFYLLPAVNHRWGVWAAIPATEAITLLIIAITYMLTERRHA